MLRKQSAHGQEQRQAKGGALSKLDGCPCFQKLRGCSILDPASQISHVLSDVYADCLQRVVRPSGPKCLAISQIAARASKPRMIPPTRAGNASPAAAYTQNTHSECESSTRSRAVGGARQVRSTSALQSFNRASLGFVTEQTACAGHSTAQMHLSARFKALETQWPFSMSRMHGHRQGHPPAACSERLSGRHALATFHRTRARQLQRTIANEECPQQPGS